MGLRFIPRNVLLWSILEMSRRSSTLATRFRPPQLSRHTTIPDQRSMTRFALRQRRSLTPDALLLVVISALAILADVETESGVPWKSLSVHSGEHRALSVDVVVNLNG